MTTSGYTLIEIPNPTQTLVHVHPSGNELGSVYRADLPINATAGTFAELLASLPAPSSKPWSGTTKELNDAFLASIKPLATPGSVQFAEVVKTVSDMMPEHG